MLNKAVLNKYLLMNASFSNLPRKYATKLQWMDPQVTDEKEGDGKDLGSCSVRGGLKVLHCPLLPLPFIKQNLQLSSWHARTSGGFCKESVG